MSNYFLVRSKELENRDPVVSYYCKYYAVKLMIEETKEKDVITKWLTELEAQQKSGVEAIVNHLVGKAHVEQFALKVFNNADNQYREGGRTQLRAFNVDLWQRLFWRRRYSWSCF
jgi:vacuolar protein sorting-associated protein VTA1